MSLSPGTRIGSYEITGTLGAGGMGEVYRATDTHLGRAVAIKVLPEAFAHDADRLARFDREARTLATLNSPNIAAIYGLERTQGQTALVMELVEGPTLADRIAEGPLPVDEALALARQIAQALEAAHEQGIVHRDLKPANIKLRADGAIKVLDFGLAKVVEPAGTAPSDVVSFSPTITSPAMTQLGVILGTAAYMSPEQARGKTTDRRTDIWALGCVLYEMLTGMRTFDADEVTDTLAHVITKEPDWRALPESVPPSITRLLRRCLEKDRRRRLDSAAVVQLEIDEALTTPSEIVPAIAPAPASGRTNLWWIAVSTTAVLLASVLALLYLRPDPPQAVVRFQFVPPEKSTAQNFQLSPDGDYLAFIGGEGTPKVWVRALDTLESRALPGTEGASFPFWSPDSTAIGFFAQGKLKKIPRAGGPATTLADAVGTRGGAWGRGDVILFVPNNSLVLHSIAAKGGTSAPITSTDGSETHRFPEFLPDGRRFLYTVLSNKSSTNGVYLASLDSTPRTRLLPELTRAMYVADGRSGFILFRRDTTLMAQPFDPDQIQAGEAFPIAEDVGSASTAFYGDFSVSRNGSLTYASGTSRRQMFWANRSGKELSLAGPPDEYNNIRLGPDDNRIAFDRNLLDVWVLDVARGSSSRLTSNPSAENLPAWSHDGSRIAFSSNRNGGYDVYVKPASGSGQEQLLVKIGTPTGWVSDWSYDGRFVLIQRPSDTGGQDLFIAPLFGDQKPTPYLQTEFNDQEGRFSPDGRYVAYVSNETTRDEIYVQGFPRSDEKIKVSTDGGTEPQWRKDGSELFYLAADRSLMVVSVRTGSNASTALPEFGQATKLFPVATYTTRRNYAVSADGQRVLVTRPIGATPPIIVVMNWLDELKRSRARTN